MDYLRSFLIGTTGLVTFNHVASLALADKSYYDFSFKAYSSFIAPVFYGVMAMLATYLRKSRDLSLRQSLAVTSLIAYVFIICFSYFYSRQHYKPYKNFTRNQWLRYMIDQGMRYMINFNVIIYLLEYYFKIYPVKMFVIGSSMASYLITYLKVMWLDNKGKLKYDYRTFAVGEPFIQGIDLTVFMYVFNKILRYSTKQSLSIWAVGSSFIWLVLALLLGTYKYGFLEWIIAFTRVFLTGVFKAFIFYYLLKHL